MEPSFETLHRIVAACGLELGIRLSEADPDRATLLEANLQLTPDQRLDQLVRTVVFIEAGREAINRADRNREEALNGGNNDLLGRLSRDET